MRHVWRWGLVAAILSMTACGKSEASLGDGSPFADGMGYYDLTYARPPSGPLRLNLLTPATKGSRRVPVVVYFHGGGWFTGSKDDPGAYVAGLRMGDVFDQVVRRGYAVAVVNYRLSAVATFPAQVEDGKAAIRWVRANAAAYGLDPHRVGVWGASAGGYLAAMVATSAGVPDFEGSQDGSGQSNGQSSKVQAAVDWFGPTYFTASKSTSPEAQMLGRQDPALFRRASPITYVDPGDPPFLIAHGTADPLVSPKHSQLLGNALRKAGVPVEMKSYQAAHHDLLGYVRPQEVVDDLLAFLDARLKQGPA